MEDRRYQVFVSSTFFDLQEERAAVVSALLQLDAIPAGMELFPAADDDAWTLITRVIDACDYYLLVIGGKYGSVDPKTELSYTEKEYDYAQAQKKPVLAFLHGKPEELKVKDFEKDEKAREKLVAFRKRVETAKHVKYWNGPDDLGGKVALSFASFRKTYPAVGWIRGDAQTSTESLAELNELRKKVAKLEQELGGAGSGPPAESEGLSKGQDRVTFEAETSVQAWSSDEQPWDAATWTGTMEVKVSWDDLFGCVGPELLDEASDAVMQTRIDGWLAQRFGDDATDLVSAAVKERGGDLGGSRNAKVTLAADDFGTLIIQLRALGLIAKSDKNRSVKDTATYWTLTPYGDQHLTSVRAIRLDEPDKSGVEKDKKPEVSG